MDNNIVHSLVIGFLIVGSFAVAIYTFKTAAPFIVETLPFPFVNRDQPAPNPWIPPVPAPAPAPAPVPDFAVNAVINSPLEQFSILPLIPMKIGDLYFSFTNPSLFMLLTLSLVLLLLYFVTKKGGGNPVPNAWQSLVERSTELQGLDSEVFPDM